MKLYKLFVGIISFCALGTSMVVAQNGDQILDGIGETGTDCPLYLQQGCKRLVS